MFKPGEIVYHDKQYFEDKILDSKNKRPCVVLYEIENDEIKNEKRRNAKRTK